MQIYSAATTYKTKQEVVDFLKQDYDLGPEYAVQCVDNDEWAFSDDIYSCAGCKHPHADSTELDTDHMCAPCASNLVEHRLELDSMYADYNASRGV